MKQALRQHKSPQQSPSMAMRRPVTDSDGIAIAPPEYGIAWIDRQRTASAAEPGTQENHTGLPAPLKAGIESLSGLAMDDVRVHYNSAKPAQVQALAYTQGANIYLAPQQEKHLPHEAWHVVQQKQGRVPTPLQAKGATIHEDQGLEREADVMGKKALQGTDAHMDNAASATATGMPLSSNGPIMRKVGFEYEIGYIETQKSASWFQFWSSWGPHRKGEVILPRTGYNITGDIAQNAPGQTNIEFVTDAFDETQPSEIKRISQVANDIFDDAQAIFQASASAGKPQSGAGEWVGADQIPQLGGSWWHRFLSRTQNWDTVTGQLQMTGGVQIDKLVSVASGSAFGTQPTLQEALSEGQGAAVEMQAVLNYYRYNPANEALQTIFDTAREAVGEEFGTWNATRQEMLASVVALMAQIPIDTRGAAPAEGAGLFLAKTDYARILELVVQAINTLIPKKPFLAALLKTINAFVSTQDAVDAAASVLPAYYRSQGISFTDVSFRNWVEAALPGKDVAPGRDLLTSQHYPGTPQQRKELRAYGTYGAKTDPGDKVILEWRSLRGIHPRYLETLMLRLADYVERRVNT